jgi:hypothetical protein
MTTWTVISTTARMGVGPLTAQPFAAIQGRVDVAGRSLHVTTVDAVSADSAMAAVRDAVQIVGGIPHQDELYAHAERWTVIGRADNGTGPSWDVVAMVADEHEVEGRYESMLSHRWVRVVDAPTASDAEDVGYRAAAVDYEDAWN